MLIVVTGLPGAGKTLYTLSKLLPQYRGRPLWVNGIPAIDHEHFASRELDEPEKWYECSEASVIVIDEAQRIFPVRKVGAEVPVKCAQFETHRHKGFDVVLMTQDAMLLDVHLRRLVGKHLHVHRLFGGHTANIYEYAEFQQQPASTASRKLALSIKTFRYPKEVFDRYKSADAHTVKRRLPGKLFVAPVAFLALIGCVWWGYHAVQKLKISKQDIDSSLGITSSASGFEGPQVSGGSGMTPLQRAQAFVPVVAGIPWTAPAYMEVMRVQSAPRPHCLLVHDVGVEDCRCYTQQATRMADFPPELCIDIVRNGWFDYTRSDAAGGSREQRERGRASLLEHQTDSPGALSADSGKSRIALRRSDPGREVGITVLEPENKVRPRAGDVPYSGY